VLVHSALAKCLQLTERFRSTTTPFDVVRAKDALNLHNALNDLLVTFCKFMGWSPSLVERFRFRRAVVQLSAVSRAWPFQAGETRQQNRTNTTRKIKLIYVTYTRWSPSLVMKFRIKRRAAQRGVDSASGFAGSRNVRTRRGHR
jgi:hypothetical protein